MTLKLYGLLSVTCFLLLTVPLSSQVQTNPSVGFGALQSGATLAIPDGTPVRLSLDQALSSATSEVGETIHFRVADDVRVGNAIAIPSGTPATGHIVNDEHKKMMGRGGKIEFAIDYVKPYNSSQIKVRATSQKQGKDSTGKVITFTVLISPLFLMLHGKEAIIPQGTTVTAYVDGKQDLPLSVAAASAGPIVVPTASLLTSAISDPQASSPAAANELSSVTFTSEPSGAEIAIDGDFTGNTPSTVKLSAGHHTIKATKSGYKDWERNLNVTAGGSLTINMTLEKIQQ